MIGCRHSSLELLPEKEKRMRCRRCHLTIARTELQGGHCPECYETSGMKYYEWDEVEDAKGVNPCYRCEQCGAIVTI